MVGSLTEASARHGPATCVLHPAINLQRIVVGTAGLAGTTPLSRFTARDYLSPPARPGADTMRVQRVRVKRAGVLINTFLEHREESNCWDVHAPDSEGEGEAVAPDVPPIPRPADPAERWASKPEPLVLGPGALLALLGISVRYINSPEAAERAVEILVDKAGHFGLDVETAKTAAYAHLGQAGLNPHLSKIRLIQLYADRKSTRLNSSHLGISYAV